MPKILTTVLSYDKGHYIEWQKAQEETFGSIECKDMDIIYYYGDHNRVELKGNKLYVDVLEGFYDIGNKTMKMFEYVLKNFEFDYLFRPNSSAFFIPDNVVKFIDKFAPKENCYLGEGRIVRHYSNLRSRSGILPGLEGKSRKLWLRRSSVPFASGMGYVLSRDVVEGQVENYYDMPLYRRIYNEIIDDVALGITIGHTGTDLINLHDLQPSSPYKRTTFKSFKDLNRALHTGPWSQQNPRVTGDYINEFVYRCKTEDPQECVKIMHELYSTLIVKE